MNAMTSLEKLIERIRARPPRARFGDVQALLEEYGWRKDREKGSHVTFVKDGERPITAPKDGGRWVKRVYLELLRDRLRLDE
jgi:predicted RNA binding protein YcfA (HicA-like mRNA interferase family)